MNPADAYALVPDENDPTSWRLPLYNEDGTPSARRVRYAMGRLSPDAHPTVPVRHMAEARRRILAAWAQMHPGSEPPRVLVGHAKKAATTFEGDDEQTGVMLCFGLDRATVDQLVVEGADGIEAQTAEQMHLTVGYLGGVERWPVARLEALAKVMRAFVVRCGIPPLTGRVTGGALFKNGDRAVAVALADVQGLDDLVDSLDDWLAACGVERISDYDAYVPHITRAQGGADADLAAIVTDVPTVPLVFTELMLVAGAQVWTFPLDGPLPLPTDPMAETATDWGAGVTGSPTFAAADLHSAVMRAADEQRYTFTPLYVPGALDAHGEWVTAQDLQAAVWDFMRHGDRNVNLQHKGGVAGEVVEMVAWPYEAEVEMVNAAGDRTTITLPAGTVYQGTVWEPWAWERIKRGELTGLSLEGAAIRVRTKDEVKA